MSNWASLYHLGILFLRAYEAAFSKSRLMTATTSELRIMLNAGPLFFSVTSPQPMNPHFTLSNVIIVCYYCIFCSVLQMPVFV